MTRWTFVATLGVVGMLVAVGCSPLAPLPDRSRYYTLTVPASAAAPARASGATVYGLGPVTLPAYLDRNQIVTRLSPSEVAYSQWDRWAEPLPANVTAVLRHSLLGELGIDDLETYPWTRTDVDYQIEVAFLQFETDVRGETELVADWSIRDVRGGRALARKQTVLTRTVAANDRAASTTALGAMVSELGHEIAAAVRDLPRPAATAPRPRAK
jgi:hypothetical protein